MRVRAREGGGDALQHKNSETQSRLYGFQWVRAGKILQDTLGVGPKRNELILTDNLPQNREVNTSKIQKGASWRNQINKYKRYLTSKQTLIFSQTVGVGVYLYVWCQQQRMA